MIENRQVAGRKLADRLARYKERDPVVLALPRGGVPVAYEVAKALEAPLDLVLVRKIGAPGQPELAVGAVADGPRPETAVNREVLGALGLSDDFIAEESQRQLREIERRRQRYLGDRPPVSVAGKTAIVVDDGIATGATTRVALRSVRRGEPARLILAVPVAPADTVEALKAEADEIVCLETPEPFFAISLHYGDFHQLDDDEVAAIMQAATEGRGPTTDSGDAG